MQLKTDIGIQDEWGVPWTTQDTPAESSTLDQRNPLWVILASGRDLQEATAGILEAEAEVEGYSDNLPMSEKCCSLTQGAGDERQWVGQPARECQGGRCDRDSLKQRKRREDEMVLKVQELMAWGGS